MFGPDICGTNRIVHVIFNYKGNNLLKKVTIPAKYDEDAHLYTLVVSADNTYKVLIDNDEAAAGSLEEGWEFLKPKTVPDASVKKPEDWDERPEVCGESVWDFFFRGALIFLTFYCVLVFEVCGESVREFFCGPLICLYLLLCSAFFAGKLLFHLVMFIRKYLTGVYEGMLSGLHPWRG